ncbi:MAG: saccharopine dehydrogenase NADP-binding domain-containing protein [Candidimonas sp.]
MKKIIVLGVGKIGQTIIKMLSRANYIIAAADKNEILVPLDNGFLKTQKFDVNDESDVKKIIDEYDVIVSAMPFWANRVIANIAGNCGKMYFDLTEDVDTTNYIHDLSLKYPSSTFVPQCGLAPGAINIISHGMIELFDQVERLELRVGALPKFSNNHGYYLSWSTDGLVNEYVKPCMARIDNLPITVQPLDGLETIIIDGSSYEAFNTSGGIGDLYQSEIPHVNYKSIRYHGHHDKMKFLLNDLNLKDDIDLMISLMNRLPQAISDCVIMFISCQGHVNGSKKIDHYVKTINSTDDMTAIALTTSAGLCAVLDIVVSNDMKGFISHKDIDMIDFVQNQFGSIFKL